MSGVTKQGPELISLDSINRQFFVTELQYVLCDVGTAFYIIWVKPCFFDVPWLMQVSRRPLTADDRLLS